MMECVGKTYLQKSSLIPALLDLVQIVLRHPPLQHHEEHAVDEEDDRKYESYEPPKVKRPTCMKF